VRSLLMSTWDLHVEKKSHVNMEHLFLMDAGRCSVNCNAVTRWCAHSKDFQILQEHAISAACPKHSCFSSPSNTNIPLTGNLKALFSRPDSRVVYNSQRVL
jgi:hypothetical protein